MSADRPNFYKHTPARAMGSETEYTVQSESMRPLMQSATVKPHVVYESSANDLFLNNGARLYFDMVSDGSPLSIIEYATPECLSAEALLIHEKVGEQIITAYGYEQELHQTVGFPVFKRSAYVQIAGVSEEDVLEATSVGHHENYSTPLDKQRELPILSYLVTRPLWAGAGIVTEGGFDISQKHGAINFTAGEALTTGHGCKTPLRWRHDRLEVRTGDGNMSPWAIRTKYAMTSLVLRLVEHNAFPQEALFSSREDMEVASFVSSTDPLAQLPGLRRADLNTPLHQELIAQRALDFANKHKVPDAERQAAIDVLTISRTLRQPQSLIHAAEQIADRVDWAAKLGYIRRRVGIEGISLGDICSDSLSNVMYDLLWEAMGTGSPSDRHYRSIGNTVDSKNIAAALHTPPNSRAKFRTQILREFRGSIESACWDEILLDDGTKFRLNNPDTN
ncbi:MAG: proteasome accessory factor PafA2 family protein [Candidatus Saccharimonas sp.]